MHLKPLLVVHDGRVWDCSGAVVGAVHRVRSGSYELRDLWLLSLAVRKRHGVLRLMVTR